MGHLLWMKAEHESWENEGGHLSSTFGRVVSTPRCDLAYQAVLTRGTGVRTERAFATSREAEAFIRRNTPRPPARCTLYDRPAGESLCSNSQSEVSS